MPAADHFRFEYDPDSGVLAIRMFGEVDDEIFKACYAATASAARTRDVRGGLMDLTGVERYDVSADAIRQASKLTPLFTDPTPRVIVAPKADVFGMARMFQIVSPGGRDALQVVRSFREAYDVLGLSDAPHFERLDTPDILS